MFKYSLKKKKGLRNAAEKIDVQIQQNETRYLQLPSYPTKGV
jgi:hypothetical protein